MYLPVFWNIESDEYFPAWLSVLASLNGLTIKQIWDILGDVSISPKWQYDETLLCRNIYQFSLNDKFPTVQETLRYHTDYFITLPFYRSGEQAGRLAEMLYNDDTYNEKNIRFKKYKYCPCCVKNDLKEHYRIIAHTPHQLADTCYKHGVKLITEPFSAIAPEPASKEEIRKAVFIYELFKNPVFTDLSQLIKIHGKKNHFVAAYLTSSDGSLKNMSTVMDIYKDSAEFRKSFSGESPLYTIYCPVCKKSYLQHQWNPRCPICDLKKDQTKRIHDRLPDYMNVIKKDGTYFLHHQGCGVDVNEKIRSALWTPHSCSNCEKLNISYWEAKLKGMTNGDQFRITGVQKRDSGYQIQLEHLGFDHTIVRRSGTFFHKGSMKCEVCKMEKIQKRKIGMKKKNIEGETMEILDYYGYENIKVKVGKRIIEEARYSDFKAGTLLSHSFSEDVQNKYLGLKIYNKRYNMWMEVTGYEDAYHAEATFEDGYVAANCKIVSLIKGKCYRSDDLEFRKKKYLGLKSFNKTCNQRMTIIGYEDSTHVTVQFEDGAVVCNARLSHFRKGLIRYPFKETRIGETNFNTEGYLMTITGYRKSIDIDVTFKDGTTIEHRTMQEFKTGTIKYPVALKHVGRTNIARNGMKITLIAYHDSKHVDIEFEDGAKVYNRTLFDFNIGKIGHPDKKRKTEKNT